MNNSHNLKYWSQRKSNTAQFAHFHFSFVNMVRKLQNARSFWCRSHQQKFQNITLSRIHRINNKNKRKKKKWSRRNSPRNRNLLNRNIFLLMSSRETKKNLLLKFLASKYLMLIVNNWLKSYVRNLLALVQQLMRIKFLFRVISLMISRRFWLTIIRWRRNIFWIKMSTRRKLVRKSKRKKKRKRKIRM